jgi:sugar lactone lactonase YvrE
MRGLSTNAIRLVATAAALVTVSAGSALASGSATSYTVWTIAGSSAQCSAPPACGDGQAATAAQLSFPQAVAVGPTGNVYIADWGDNQVREVTPAGTISVIAGSGTFCQRTPSCGDGGRATSAELNYPAGVAVDSAGNVYVADTGDNEIRKVSPSGTITRFAGTGSTCAHPPACGDGGPATAATLTGPTGLAMDKAGNLYIADAGDQEIRKVTPAGQISRVAGTGRACHHPPSCGDQGAATGAQLSFPEGVAVGPAGVLYIADSGDQEIRKVSSGGTITRVAGTGVACSSPPSCGDGGAATSARLNYPDGVVIGPAGSLFIADSSDNEVREVTGGKITRLSGNGTACAKPPACGDDNGASAATLNYPNALAVDGHGNLYVADTGDNEIRWLSRVQAAHILTTTGSVALGALSPTVTKSSVAVRYVLGRPANVELTVRHDGHSETVATVRAHAGFGELTWNRRFRGGPAPKGRYQLTVSAAIGTHSASRTVRLHL